MYTHGIVPYRFCHSQKINFNFRYTTCSRKTIIPNYFQKIISSQFPKCIVGSTFSSVKWHWRKIFMHEPSRISYIVTSCSQFQHAKSIPEKLSLRPWNWSFWLSMLENYKGYHPSAVLVPLVPWRMGHCCNTPAITCAYSGCRTMNQCFQNTMWLICIKQITFSGLYTSSMHSALRPTDLHTNVPNQESTTW